MGRQTKGNAINCCDRFTYWQMMYCSCEIAYHSDLHTNAALEGFSFKPVVIYIYLFQTQ